MNLLDNLAKSLREEKPRRIPTSHYPSSATLKTESGEVIGKCLRSLYYQWTDAPVTNPTADTSIMRMSLGTFLHEAVIPRMAGDDFTIETETPLRVKVEGLKNEISLRTDGIVKDKFGAKTGIEVKFTFGKGGTEIKKYGLTRKRDWLLQVLLYGKLTGIKDWQIVTIDFPSLYRAIFYLEVGEDHIAVNNEPIMDISYSGIIQRWAELESHLDNKTVPERDFDKEKNWQCKFCQFTDHCYAG